MTKERQSNFELLRIVLIIMVLSLHYLGVSLGGALDVKNIPEGYFNYYLARFIESFSIIAVDCFVIITGYFMCKKQKIKCKRILELVLIYFFYLFSITIGVVLFKPKLFDISIFTDALFMKNSGAWFIITYVILYLLIPYLNRFIEKINRKEFRTLIIITLFFFSILPTFFQIGTVKDNGYGITMFIVLYFIGAYICKYKVNTRPAGLYFLIFMFSQFITFSNFLNERFFNTLGYNSLFNIIGAVCFFLFFSKLNIKSSIVNKVINKLSVSVFSIYIIHMNSFISKYIWQGIFNCSSYYTDKLFIVNLIISVISVFIVCVIIDFFRIKIFKFIQRFYVS